MEKRNKNSHYKFSGYDSNLQPVMKPKKGYDKEEDALLAARKMNLDGKNIHKLVIYKCSECHKFHIGRNNSELTERERDRIKRKMQINGNLL